MTVPRNRWLAALAILLACLLLAPAKLLSAQPATPEKIQEVEDAIKKFQQSDFTSAFDLLKDARKKNPDLQPAQIMMARLFAAANLPGGVRNWLEKAVVDLPDDPEAYLILADFNLREGRFTEADMLLGKSASLLPAFKASRKRKEAMQPQILAGQAAVAEYREDWTGAQKFLEAWLALDKEDANILQRLGRVLFLQNKDATLKEAYTRFKEAKALDKKVLLPEAQMAQLYEAAGQHESAQKWMDSALKLAPKDDIDTRLVASQWAVGTDQIDKAAEWAAAALKIDEKNFKGLIMAGIVALFQEQFNKAEVYFETAHLLEPTNFAATNNLALALVEQDKDRNAAAKKRKALEYATANVERNKQSSEAWSTYGWVLYKNEKLEEAEKALTNAVSGGNPGEDTRYYFARVLIDKNRNELALQLLKSAVESKRPFTKRREAKLLLEELKARVPDDSEKPKTKTGKTSGKTPDKSSDKTSG
jgi:tetratricopeptide (TPR) repeat protein